MEGAAPWGWRPSPALPTSTPSPCPSPRFRARRSTGLEAAIAIFVAAVANSVTKTGIAFYAGTAAFGLRYGAITLAAVVAAAAILFGQTWLVG